jgi:hypothetical protein
LVQTQVFFTPNPLLKSTRRVNRPRDDNRIQIPRFTDFRFDSAPRSRFFSFQSNEVAIVDGQSGSIALIGFTGRQDIHVDESALLCLASDGETIVTGGRDAVVHVLRNPNVSLFGIPLYCGDIICSSVSVAFGLIACGTADGFLMLCSIDRRSIAKVIDLEGQRPSNVLITEGWGFVVLSCKHVENGEMEHTIEVYSVNGDFIGVG